MNWTTHSDIRSQVNRLWNRGLLLSSMVSGDDIFPKRLILKGPDSKELSERFSEVQDWIAKLEKSATCYRIEWKSINHRILGRNEIPSAVRIDTLNDALRISGRREAADRFKGLVGITKEKRPELMPWLAKRPLKALELAEEWSGLLLVVDWLIRHNRPGIYLRQIDLPGIHTKFIEAHRGTLAELLDLVLPEEAINEEARGVSGFCRRYGFLDKPLRVRFKGLLIPLLTRI